MKCRSICSGLFGAVAVAVLAFVLAPLGWGGSGEQGLIGEVWINSSADAIAHAASLLGEEVDRRIERFERTRCASEKRPRPAGRIPLSAAAPAPSPAATNWGAIR